MKIGIIGCGNLGMSLLKGIQDQMPHAEIWASKRNVTDLQNEARVFFTNDNQHVIEQADYLIIALKPYTILPFLKEYRESILENQNVVISVATGITIAEMQAILGESNPIYRAMPNTAASVHESITAIATHHVVQETSVHVNSIFKAIGEVIEIEESLMEAATIIGACGIAYVLRFMRAMIQGGVEVGFDSATATKIVSQTMKGAATLIIEHKNHPEQEIDRVTTPKGCTIVGLNEMEHSGFSSALIKGIVSSYHKIAK